MTGEDILAKFCYIDIRYTQNKSIDTGTSVCITTGMDSR